MWVSVAKFGLMIGQQVAVAIGMGAMFSVGEKMVGGLSPAAKPMINKAKRLPITTYLKKIMSNVAGILSVLWSDTNKLWENASTYEKSLFLTIFAVLIFIFIIKITRIKTKK